MDYCWSARATPADKPASLQETFFTRFCFENTAEWLGFAKQLDVALMSVSDLPVLVTNGGWDAFCLQNEEMFGSSYYVKSSENLCQL